MKSNFKDPIAIKKQTPKDNPKDGSVNLGWDATCPKYDERDSVYVCQGTDYGVGINQTVGHKGSAKLKVDTLPYGTKVIEPKLKR